MLSKLPHPNKSLCTKGKMLVAKDSTSEGYITVLGEQEILAIGNCEGAVCDQHRIVNVDHICG